MEPLTSSAPVRESDARPWPARPPREVRDRYWLHLLLFLITLASTVYSGGMFVGRILRFEHLGAWWFVPDGLAFGLSLLLFLGIHEFGHYFAARRNGIDTSLPYFIPAPFVAAGTLGAVIRIREPIPSIRKLFDVGAAGPVAGFVVALGLLLFALATLPPPTYLFDLPYHEDIKAYIDETGRFPAEMLSPPGEGEMVIVMGQTPLYWFLTQFFENVPPMYEMYHYPVLFAAWLGLFFTALNLLPVGQLDGGHILYALVGPKWHSRLARGFMVALLLSGSIGFLQEVAPDLAEMNALAGQLSWFLLAGILYFYLKRIFSGDHRYIAPFLLAIMVASGLAQRIGPAATRFGYSGWLVFGLLIVLLVKIEHPPVRQVEPLTPGRKVIGVLSILIFLLCFSIRPIYIL